MAFVRATLVFGVRLGAGNGTTEEHDDGGGGA